MPSNGAFCKNMAIMIMSTGNQLTVRVSEDTVVSTSLLCCQLQRHSREMRWCANQLASAHSVQPYYFVTGKTFSINDKESLICNCVHTESIFNEYNFNC